MLKILVYILVMNKEAIHKIERAMSKAEYGSTYTFDQLSGIAGTDVRSHRSIISCANRQLLRHHDRCLVNIWGKGYRLEPDSRAPLTLLKELGMPRKSYCITEVSQLDDGKGNQPALLIVYQEKDDGNKMDSAIINLLLEKKGS